MYIKKSLEISTCIPIPIHFELGTFEMKFILAMLIYIEILKTCKNHKFTAVVSAFGEIDLHPGVEVTICQDDSLSEELTDKWMNKGISQIALISHNYQCYDRIGQTEFDDESILHLFFIKLDNSTRVSKILDKIRSGYDNSCWSGRKFPIFILIWPEILKSELAVEKLLEELTAGNSSSLPLAAFIFIQFSWLSLSSTTSANSSGLWEIYSIQSSIPVTRRIIDPANFNGDLDLDKLIKIGKRRSDLRGANLRVLAKNNIGNQGEAVVYKDSNGTIHLVGGLTVRILNDLKSTLNFTVTTIEGGSSIRETPDGKLTGLGQQIVDGLADLSLVMGNNLGYRRRWLYFLPPIMRDRAYTFFMQPHSSSSRNLLAAPFSGNLWLALSCTFIVLFLSALAAYKTMKSRSKVERSYTTAELALWTVASICQQGWYNSPKTRPLRIIFFVGSLTWIVTLVAYSGSIVAILSQKEKPIKGFPDLVDSGFTIIGNVSTSYNHSLSTGHIAILEKRVAALSQTLSINDSIREVFRPNSKIATTININEFYSFVQEDGQAEHQLQICRVERLRASSKWTKTGMFIRRDSDLKEFLNLKIMALHERGYISRYKIQYFGSFIPTCDKDAVKTIDSLEIADARLAYGIFLVGFAISLIVFIIEYFKPVSFY